MIANLLHAKIMLHVLMLLTVIYVDVLLAIPAHNVNKKLMNVYRCHVATMENALTLLTNITAIVLSVLQEYIVNQILTNAVVIHAKMTEHAKI